MLDRNRTKLNMFDSRRSWEGAIPHGLETRIGRSEMLGQTERTQSPDLLLDAESLRPSSNADRLLAQESSRMPSQESCCNWLGDPQLPLRCCSGYP
ncbi:hypothetical protein KC19_3G125500 [Ceratodon purpureus]|uniref:Uncharacterized protein n=1 Tax=Ceratodon purpureus TaxID=3225 RepID=A0A8T0IKB0_CERPU|nr:hypothetical protein KC19_3G125500 [Ceratodon purpureus]